MNYIYDLMYKLESFMLDFRFLPALMALYFLSASMCFAEPLNFFSPESSGYFFRLSVQDKDNKKHCLEVVTRTNCNNRGQSDPVIAENGLTYFEWLGSVSTFIRSLAGCPPEPAEIYRNLDDQPCSNQCVSQRWVYRPQTHRIEYWPNAYERLGKQVPPMCLTRQLNSTLVLKLCLPNVPDQKWRLCDGSSTALCAVASESSTGGVLLPFTDQFYYFEQKTSQRVHVDDFRPANPL